MKPYPSLRARRHQLSKGAAARNQIYPNPNKKKYPNIIPIISLIISLFAIGLTMMFNLYSMKKDKFDMSQRIIVLYMSQDIVQDRINLTSIMDREIALNADKLDTDSSITEFSKSVISKYHLEKSVNSLDMIYRSAYICIKSSMCEENSIRNFVCSEAIVFYAYFYYYTSPPPQLRPDTGDIVEEFAYEFCEFEAADKPWMDKDRDS
ncbi:MAG: hypothetical protein ACRC67_10935 [Inquilinus sp.]|uniref:hypothetical protein n=1 Tax=Inquilinus sp. TaxID=1932117 RepID=UPI003F2C1DD0